MVLLYSSAGNDFLGALKHRLNGHIHLGRLKSYTRLEDLFHRLLNPHMNLEIGVFASKDPAELDRLISMRNLLTSRRLVVAVANDDPHTLSKVQALTLRFITFIENGIAPLISVLKRMMAIG